MNFLLQVYFTIQSCTPLEWHTRPKPATQPANDVPPVEPMEPTTNDSELPEPPSTKMPDPKRPPPTTLKPGSSGKPKSVHQKHENPEKGNPHGHSSQQMSSGAAPAGSHPRPQKSYGNHVDPGAIQKLTTRRPTTTTKPRKPVEMPSEAAENVAKAGAIEAGQPPTAGKGTATKNADRDVINENGRPVPPAADNEEAPLEAPEDAENEEVMNDPEEKPQKPHGVHMAAEDAENEEVMNNPETQHEESKGANEEALEQDKQTKPITATDEDSKPPHGEPTTPVDDTNEEANSSTPPANEEAETMTSTGRSNPADEGKKNEVEVEKGEGPPVPKERASTDTDEEEIRTPSSSVETKENAEDHEQEAERQAERTVPDAKDNEEDPESVNDNNTEMTEVQEDEAPEEEDTQNQIPAESTSKENTLNTPSSNGDDSPASSESQKSQKSQKSQAVELSESTKTSKSSEAPELQDKHPANKDSDPVKTALAKPAVKPHSSHSHSTHANDHSHHAHEHTDADKLNHEVQEPKESTKREYDIAELEKERRKSQQKEVQKDVSVLVDNLLTGATQQKIDRDIAVLAGDVV